MSVDAPIASSQSETRTPIANLFVHSARALPLTPMLPKSRYKDLLLLYPEIKVCQDTGRKLFEKQEEMPNTIRGYGVSGHQSFPGLNHVQSGRRLRKQFLEKLPDLQAIG